MKSFIRSGGVYPRQKIGAITATGGDKPRHYFFLIKIDRIPQF
jgi:hypothetical protein